MKRKKFIIQSSLALMGINPFTKEIYHSIGNQDDIREYLKKNLYSIDNQDDIREYLKKILYSKQEVDEWFEGKSFPFSKYHNELGWLLNNSSFQDGLNNSWSCYTYEGDDGERLMTNYRDKVCRINTYGNSFTQCHQVSDNETWQEILAAHIQEPVRNFGVGGWSVYQAYLRMLKEESHKPANLIIFNIYEDDHLRNLDSWRNIRVKKHPQHIESTLPYLKVDFEMESISEYKNPCPTKESFYKLCNIEEVYKLFKDDFVLKIMLAHQKSKQNNASTDYSELKALSKTHGIETRIDTGGSLSELADKLHKEVALFSTQKLIEKIENYAKINHKTILYVLSYPAKYIAKCDSVGFRWDQPFIDFMTQNDLPLVDLSQAHMEDFNQYNLNLNEYLKKYFIGHYNPLGNFFCAHTMRDKVIEMLDPKPLSNVQR